MENYKDKLIKYFDHERNQKSIFSPKDLQQIDFNVANLMAHEISKEDYTVEEAEKLMDYFGITHKEFIKSIKIKKSGVN
jgi:hypothetical protein